MPEAKRNVTSIHQNNYASNNLIIVLPVFNKFLYTKVLLPYNNKTLLEYQIETLLEAFPQAEIFVIIGYESDKIIRKLYKKYPVRFITNDLHLSTNTTYGISLAIQASCRSSLLILGGNLLFDYNIKNLQTNKTQVISGTNGYIKESSVGLFTNNGIVTGFSYSFNKKWAKIALLCNKEFDMFSRLSFTNECNNLFEYEVFNKCIENGGQFENVEGKGLLREIENYGDLQ